MAVELPPSVERSELIEQYLPLVNSVARRFSGRGERQEDLAQVAALALVQAVDRRDPERAAALPAYVSRCVEGAVLRHLRDRSSSVRVPRALHAVGAREALAGPSLAALSTALRPVELDLDHVASRSCDPARLDEAAATRGLAADAIEALDARERQIVLMRFFLDFTQAEIAGSLGVSQAHVSRLLEQALAKMRRRLERASRLSAQEGRATLDRGDGTGTAAAARG
jgi:RNA polymerase sigma-B factor